MSFDNTLIINENLEEVKNTKLSFQKLLVNSDDEQVISLINEFNYMARKSQGTMRDMFVELIQFANELLMYRADCGNPLFAMNITHPREFTVGYYNNQR